MDKIELGDVAEDTITGFKGVVTSETQWLHGCRRLGIQPRAMQDGKPIDYQVFDELQLKLVKKAKKVIPATTPKGGPRPNPENHPNPVR